MSVEMSVSLINNTNERLLSERFHIHTHQLVSYLVYLLEIVFTINTVVKLYIYLSGLTKFSYTIGGIMENNKLKRKQKNVGWFLWCNFVIFYKIKFNKLQSTYLTLFFYMLCCWILNLVYSKTINASWRKHDKWIFKFYNNL